ncbi:hypothetical protein GCM10022222_84760 [Amycolatopsis ultiminotia]|uniref:YNCE-like beta-propeller domain-containing protein n=1 Tax=Amycolatopsis ultiminotia TaxID=543629 RepID=A0ABP6YRQ1_9PSEU
MEKSQRRRSRRALGATAAFALALVTAVPAQAAGPDQSAGTPTQVGGVRVYQSVVDPKTDTVFVAAYGNSAVYSYDGATGKQKAQFDLPGAGPQGLELNSTTNTLYVSNAIEDKISVLDAATGKVKATIDEPGKGPREIRVDEASNHFYVTEAHAQPGALAEYDGATNKRLREIPTDGENSAGLALDLPGKRAYVANYGTDTVSVIDLAAGKTVSQIQTGAGSNPTGVAFDPATKHLLVTLQGFGSVETVDAATGKPIAAPVSTGKQSLGVTVDSERAQAFVTNFGTNTLSVLDTKTGKRLYNVKQVGKAPITAALNTNTHEVWVSAGGWDGASDSVVKVVPHQDSATVDTPVKVGDVSVYQNVVDPATNTVYVASFGNSAVYAYDGATGKEKEDQKIVLPNRPMGLGINVKTRTLYTSDGIANTVQVVDLDTGAVKATLPFGEGSAREIRVDETTNRFYVTEPHAEAGTLDEFDGATNQLLRRIPTDGKTSAGLALDPAAQRAYVSNVGSGTVSVIDLTTGTVTAKIGTGDGSQPTAVAVNPAAQRAYVTLQGFNSVETIDTEKNLPVGAPAVSGQQPLGITVDAELGRVYAVNYGGSTLAVFDAVSGKKLGAVPKVGTAPINPGLNTNTHEVWVSAGGYTGGANTLTKVSAPARG